MKHDHEVNHNVVVSTEVKRKIAKARQHLKDNKTTYLIGAGSLAAGYFLRGTKTATVIQEVAAPVIHNTVAPSIAPVIAPVFNNAVNNGGYARKIIRCVETDQMWPSMSKAAEAAGHSLQRMSDQIHGRTDHLDGLHYVIDGVTAS